MKLLTKTSRSWKTVLWAGVAGALLLGCNSAPRHNRRVYDRYAELVAEKNRTLQQAERPAPVAAPAPVPSKPVPAPAAKPAPAPEVKPAPAPVPPKPAPVQVIAPAPKPVPAPAPVPKPPAPVPAVVEAGLPSAEDSSGYTLKKGDAVQVYLRGIPSAELIEGIIDEHGTISLPFINEVVAEGQTASELSRTIRRIYQEQGIYQNMSVNVVVPTRFYFIQGEIRAPGRFQIVSATRISQAIAAAGGYTEFASGRVAIKRGGKLFKTIRNARRLERTPQDDVLLEPDDIIEVQRSRW